MLSGYWSISGQPQSTAVLLKHVQYMRSYNPYEKMQKITGALDGESIGLSEEYCYQN